MRSAAETRRGSNCTGSRFRYTGQIALPEAYLYHYKARVYDPVLGRFLQTDPVGYEDDLNLYGYVGGDPADNRDPTGLDGLSLFDPDSVGKNGENGVHFDAVAKAAAAANGLFVVGAHGGIQSLQQYMWDGSVLRNGHGDVAYWGAQNQFDRIVRGGYKGDMPLLLLYCQSAAFGNAYDMAKRSGHNVIATAGFVQYREPRNGQVTFTAGSTQTDSKPSSSFSIFTPNGSRVDGITSIKIDQKNGTVSATREVEVTGSRIAQKQVVQCDLTHGCK